MVNWPHLMFAYLNGDQAQSRSSSPLSCGCGRMPGERRKVEDRCIQFSSFAHTISFRGEVRDTAYMLPARTVEQIIRDEFSSIPEVRGVQIEQDGDETLVRIAVDDPPRDLRYKIYDKQSDLVRAFPEMLFDFSLSYAE